MAYTFKHLRWETPWTNKKPSCR